MTTPDRLAAAVAQGHEDAVQVGPQEDVEERPCVQCGEPLSTFAQGGLYVHAHGLQRCQSSAVPYGHMGHPEMPCPPRDINPCKGYREGDCTHLATPAPVSPPAGEDVERVAWEAEECQDALTVALNSGSVAGLAAQSLVDQARVVIRDLRTALSARPVEAQEVERRIAAAVEEQRQMDLAMHQAYRPEVVAEVAVALSDEADWERIAAWCGGTIETGQDPSGEYVSQIRIPGVGYAWNGAWIVQRHDLSFAIRAEVEGPSEASVAALARAEAAEGRERAILRRGSAHVATLAEYAHTAPTQEAQYEATMTAALIEHVVGDAATEGTCGPCALLDGDSENGGDRG